MQVLSKLRLAVGDKIELSNEDGGIPELAVSKRV